MKSITSCGFLKTYILSFLILGANCINFIKADDKPSGTPLFTISTDDAWWQDNQYPGVEMTSLQSAGGTTWSTLAFTHTHGRQGLFCGLRDIPYVATITSDAPVKEKIGILAAYIYYGDHKEYLNSISLRVSANKDLSDYQDIVIPIQSNHSTYWNFIIPNPRKNMYYQLRIDTEAIENNWIDVMSLEFYAPDLENGISDIKDYENEISVRWFDIQGREVNNPQRGIYICKKGNNLQKVIIK